MDKYRRNSPHDLIDKLKKISTRIQNEERNLGDNEKWKQRFSVGRYSPRIKRIVEITKKPERQDRKRGVNFPAGSRPCKTE